MKISLKNSGPFLVLLVLLVRGCTDKELFKPGPLVSAGAESWWARSHAGVNGDGLLDLFRYSGHEATGYELWLNQMNQKGPSLNGSLRICMKNMNNTL